MASCLPVFEMPPRLKTRCCFVSMLRWSSLMLHPLVPGAHQVILWTRMEEAECRTDLPRSLLCWLWSDQRGSRPPMTLNYLRSSLAVLTCSAPCWMPNGKKFAVLLQQWTISFEFDDDEDAISITRRTDMQLPWWDPFAICATSCTALPCDRTSHYTTNWTT